MSDAAPAGQGYDPFDPDYTRRLFERVLAPIVKHYFRPRLLGARRLPTQGPAILAANHSGNTFPFDAMVLDSWLWKRDGLRPERKFRPMYEPELALRWWMRPFGIDNLWRTAGGVDLTFDNFERLVVRGDRVVYFPEGVPGIGKGFWRRYRLQRFSSSFVTIAARHRVPVHPVYIVNAEWCLPFSFTLRPLDWLMRSLFRVPFLPLPAAPIGMLLPWAWYFALPARMIYVVGDAIDVRAMAEREGITDFERPDRRLMRRVAEQVRIRMQAELERHVRRYGRRPYQLRSLIRALREARRQGVLGRVLPTGWSPSFIRHHRDMQRAPARGRLHAALRDWDLLAFYLPFGWALLSLTRELRCPPYGYRGVGPEERREREGAFVWRIRERPLPERTLAEAGEQRRVGSVGG
ncbi:MAG: 1-acyl-sn-glycerol-3-phosphate acyltransferase [Planctomycetota bacterium]|jgi:1-acyl-sn-glycerol-3-phosphate acyltransferase